MHTFLLIYAYIYLFTQIFYTILGENLFSIVH